MACIESSDCAANTSCAASRRESSRQQSTQNTRFQSPPNLLNQDFEAAAPCQVCVADITYIPTDEGWLYLAAIKDLCTKEIVGYAMKERMTHDLVGRALFRAVAAKKPAKGRIHNPERGSQYCSRNYQKFIKQSGIIPSMSRKCNCYGNAPMERWFGTLNMELTHHWHYKTRHKAIQKILEYIEIFYNRQRRHATLGNISPAAFERKFYKIK